MCILHQRGRGSRAIFIHFYIGWVFESQPRQTKVVKTGSDSSTAKHSAKGVNFMGPRRRSL